MSSTPILLPDFDVKRLKLLLEDPALQDSRQSIHIHRLKEELERAEVMPSRSIPADVVTMNSKVRIRDLDSGEISSYTLVFPTDADIEANKLSVLAPLGTALLGQKVGQEVEWPVPGGKVRLSVEGLDYQPEAAGIFPE